MQVANYDVFRVDMTAAGSTTIERAFDFIRIVRIEDASGNARVDGKVNLVFGRADAEKIPLGVNGGAKGNGDVAVISWAAQPGLYATIVASKGDLQLETPPANAIISTAAGNVIGCGAVTVGTAATLIYANDPGRQSLTIQNDGTADIFIGPAGVTVATGLRVALGATHVIDKTQAAVYGISGTAGQTVRYLREASA